jgi:hypothetical protein
MQSRAQIVAEELTRCEAPRLGEKRNFYDRFRANREQLKLFQVLRLKLGQESVVD